MEKLMDNVAFRQIGVALIGREERVGADITLPRRELLDRLLSLTNLRVVEDKSTATGYKTAVGPVPSWHRPWTW
jgi:hypothetical protein